MPPTESRTSELPVASRWTSGPVLAILLLVLLALVTTFALRQDPVHDAAHRSATPVDRSHTLGELRDRMPAGLRGDVTGVTTHDDGTVGWVQLPDQLDGRVRIGSPAAPGTRGEAGFRMLDAPSLERVDITGGAMYLGAEWDVVQFVGRKALREYTVVRQAQGGKTWRWQLYGAYPGVQPKLLSNGKVDLGGGYVIETPKLLDADLEALDRPVSWALDGFELSLTFDDAGLPLPYVIDPDTTAPVNTWTSWTESSPYAWADTVVTNRVWFNPNFSGSVTGRFQALDAESGIQYATWPNPPAGWTPPGGNVADGTPVNGTLATYFEEFCDNYPGNPYGCGVGCIFFVCLPNGGPPRNFAPLPGVSRFETDVNQSWGAGAPIAGIGSNEFTAGWWSTFIAPETGKYFFQTLSSDTSKVWIDDVEVLGYWSGTHNSNIARTQCAGGIDLVAGQTYRLIVGSGDDNNGSAIMQLRWRLPSQAAAYQTPTGCDIIPSPADQLATGMTGGGSATYPLMAPSYFIRGYDFERTFSWTAGASGATVNATTRSWNPVVPHTSTNLPFTFAADGTPPATAGSASITSPGWNTTGSLTFNYPSAASFTDPDSGLPASGHRTIQRRLGVPDGSGGCDTTAGTWTVLFTDPGGTSLAMASNVSDGQCAEYRYVVVDRVGNERILQAPSFRGRDSSGPTISAVTLTPVTGTGNQWVNGTTVWVNTAAAGSFTATVTASDPQSGIANVTAPAVGPAGNWTPSASTPIAGPGPYVFTYTWTAGASEPLAETLTATSGSGATATSGFTISRDNIVPNSGTATIAHTNGWQKTTPILVDLGGTMADGQSGLATMQVQRQSTTLTGANCDAFTAPWTDVGPLRTAPFTLVDENDTGAAGMCYRYRVAGTDRVGNVGYLNSTHVTRIDVLPPSAAFDPTPVGVSGTETFTGTTLDDYSGTATITLRWLNLDDGTTGLIGTDITAPAVWSIDWDTTGRVNGNYRMIIDTLDVATNQLIGAATRDIQVDNSIPILTHTSFTAASNPTNQYWDGVSNRVWVKTDTAIGSTTVRFTATAPSGIAGVAFNPAGGGWTPAGVTNDTGAPHEVTYAWPLNGSSPGLIDVTATSNSGRTRTEQFEITRDNTPPTQGTMAFDYPDGWDTDGAFTVTRSGVMDDGTGSGVASMQLQRDEVGMTAGACNAFTSTWTDVGAPVVPPAAMGGVNEVGLTSGMCYRYRMVGMDRVGNQLVVTSPKVTKIDSVDPDATIDVLPASPVRGSVTFSGTATDADSGVANIVLYAFPTGGGPGVLLDTDTSASPTWSFLYATTGLTDGEYQLRVNVIDVAGNLVVAADTRTIVVDNTAPTGSVVLAEGANPAYQHIVPGATPRIYVNTSASGSGTFSATIVPTENGSGMQSIAFPALGAGYTEAPIGGLLLAPGPYATTYTWASGASDPGAENAVMADVAGNTRTAPFEVVADPDGPTGVTITHSDGPVSTPSITINRGTDPLSGIASWRLERRETAGTGPNTCDTANWQPWGPFGGANPANTTQDGTAALNTCYQYRLFVVDNVGNETMVDDLGHIASVEPAGILIDESAGSTDVTEGSTTDTYTVRLRTPPTLTVSVTITDDNQTNVGVPSLNFTPANWNVPQTVTVTAVNDDVDEPSPHPGSVTHQATSPDPAYNNLAGPTVAVDVTDDDDAGITFSPSSTSVAVNELGATSDTYTVVLDSEPVANVTLTLGHVGGQVTFAPATITFTPANWDTPRTITITAVNDGFDETDPHPAVITHAVTSTDPLYAPLTPADVTASVSDDDTAAVIVAPTAGLNIAEELTTSANYTVVLGSVPLGDVTVNVVIDADGTVSTSTLLFTPATWNVAQTVTITAVDDSIVEGAHTTTASHTVTSPADPNYALVAAAPVVANVADNDVPGVIVTPTTGLTVDEAGPATSYTIRLATQPVADVTFSFATGSQLQPIANVTFTPANWNVAQAISVAAVQDDVDEVPSPHTGTIVHTVSSPGDPVYDAFVVADQSVAINDDDVAGVTIDELGTTEVDETGATSDTFSVVLDSEPTANVTVSFATPDGQTTTAASVTFTPADWDTPQVVTVTAVDDDIDESDPHTGAIDVTLASGDAIYAGVTEPAVGVDITDNDTAAVVIAPGTLAVDENGPTSATYTVVLATRPTANVTIELAEDAQVAVGADLVFTPANWNVAQTVTVTAVDDPVVETSPHPGLVAHAVTSGDAMYDVLAPAQKDVDITDNDVPGVSVNLLGGVGVSESGGTDIYAVVLDRAPQANVTVSVSNSDGQVSALPATLTFTPANWNVAQNFTVSAVDDDLNEADPHPGVLEHVVASGDPLWAGVTLGDVTADVADDDVPGVTVTQSAPYLFTEDSPFPGSDDTYDVVLDAEPTANVTVTLTVPTDVGTDVTVLTFTPANWDTPQTVTFGALDDLVTETPAHVRTITHAVTSGDTDFDGLPVDDVAMTITDNDIPGITVSRTDLDVTEGGAGDSFTVVLETQPTADVVVTLTGTQVGTNAPTLTFTPANWNVAQTVLVSAIDDDVDEQPEPHAGLVELSVASADAVYDAWVLSDIPVDVTDDDEAGVTVTPNTDPISLAEAGATSDTFDVVLDSEPTANVTVTFATPDGQTTLGAPSVTFTPANWDTPQTVTITAVDDNVDETDPHDGMVNFTTTSGDAIYSGIATTPLTVDIADDDTAGVTISPGTLAVDETGPTSDTYTIVLTTRPTADVTVVLAEDTQVTAGADIVFTPLNWNVAQTVTVTAVDDLIVEDPTHPGSVAHTISSTDVMYTALAPPAKDVDITDNDVPGLTVTAIGGVNVSEDGTTDNYTVVLDRAPQGNVTVTISNSDGQVGALPALLTFTPANWNVAQWVTVTAVDDDVNEADPHPGVIEHVVASADPRWVGVTLGDVTANVADDDVPGVTVTQGGPYMFTEDSPFPGTDDSYSVVLDAEPASDVTVTLTVPTDVGTDVTVLTFTSANWDTPQTVTFGALDDLVVEAPAHLRTISHVVTSGDTDFDGLPADDVPMTITDNDIPGITVSRTDLDVTEGAAGDSFDVVLDTQPTADVVITLTGTQVGTDAPTLTFTSANWNVAQTVLVDAIDDDIDEQPDPHAGSVELSVSSGDAVYDNWGLADIAVDVFDDDEAGVTVTPNTDPISLAEAGATSDTFDVVLDSEPTGNVTVTIATPDGQTTVGTGALTFTPANWDTPQTVTVTAVDDDVDETDPHDGVVEFTFGSGDAIYAALAPSTLTVGIADDDTADVVVSAGTLAVDEAGPTADTYTIVLATRPTANVIVEFAEDAQVSTGADLVFTPANWNVAQTVTVTAVDDPVVEASPHPGVVAHSVTSADTMYDVLAPAQKDVDVTDNDVPSVSVDLLGGVGVAEAGGTDTYTVVLDRAPLMDVTVSVSNADGQVGGLPALLTFTPANWNVAQVVTVTAVDDFVNEADPHPGVLEHVVASADPLWAGVTLGDVTADVADDDVPGVTVTQGGPYLFTEDSSFPGTDDDYSVVLDAQPASDVTVTLTVPTDVGTDVTVLTFTPANWDTPQVVTFGALDDLVVEAPAHARTITHAVTSGDTDFDGLPADDVVMTITDNDIPGILVSRTDLDVAEGGAGDSFDVVLETQPTADVVITLTGTQVGTDAPTLTFTPANWNVAQTVLVDAIDDDIDEQPDPHAGLVELSVASADGVYDLWALSDIPVDVTDDDEAGVTVTPNTDPISLAEAGATSDTFDVVLDSEPTADVTVTIAAPDGQTVVGSGTLTFTPANWDTPQTVTVTAVDDDVDETDPHDGVVEFTVGSGDAVYAALTPSTLTVDIADDDTADVVVSAGTLAVDEAGPTSDTYTVVLATQPTANVTVELAEDAQVSTGADLVFTPANWNVAQTVSVTAVDDPVVEASPHPGVVAHSVTSADTIYDALTPVQKDVDVTDNDVPSVSVDLLGGVGVAEAGGTDTYTVVLDRAPLMDVTVSVSNSDGQVGALPALLTFTPANWNVAQVVTVAAIDDFLNEADPHPGVLEHVVASADPLWAGVTLGDVTADVADDDVPGVTVTQAGPYLFTEDSPFPGTGDTYDVVLDAEPTADVTVTLTVPTDVGADLTVLTFTPADWNVAQTVTFGALDDLIVEAPAHLRTITHAATSADTDFDGLPVDDVPMTITDNDIPGITVSRTDLDVVEGGAGDSFTVVMDTQPTADVVITLTGTQVGTDAPTLTFTPANWNVAQTVLVDAIDDDIDEQPDPHAGLVELAVASADGVYDQWALSDITVDVTDDDEVGVTVTPNTDPIALAEAGATSDTFDVVLDSEPLQDVTVTIATPDGQTTLGSGTLTFTSANWDTPQSVTVTAVDDDIDETDPHPGAITFEAASPDSLYDALPVADLVVGIADDDTADVVISAGTLAVDETGPTSDTYTVVIASEPTADVTIELAEDTQVSTGADLVFTPADWNVAQTVTVTAVDDPVVETSPHPGAIAHAVTSADGLYAAITPAQKDVDVTDNDVPSVSVDLLGGVDVAEAGGTDTYAVVLDRAPQMDVTVSVANADGQVGGLPALLTFTPANWNVAQLVTVAAVDDFLNEADPHPGVLEHVVASADPLWSGVTLGDVTANVADDDVPGVTLTQASPYLLTEDTPFPGGSATYTVVLDAEPTADVDVTLTVPGDVDSDVTVVTFTPVNWNVAQTVTFGALDDLVVEAPVHVRTITHAVTSADTDFDGLPVPDVDMSITDNDIPGITVSRTDLDVVEGGAGDSFTVVMDTQPTADVVITLTGTQVGTDAPTLTFTPANWNVAQTVLVDAIDDDIDEQPDPHAGLVELAVASADAVYDLWAMSDIPVDVTDDDEVGVTVTPNTDPIALVEAGATSDTFDVVLDSEPLQDVTVTIATPDGQTTVGTGTLTFTSANWDTPQTVTVTAVDDDVDEADPHPGTVTFVAASADVLYDALPVADLDLGIADDDTAGVVVAPSSGLEVDEATPAVGDTFTVVLSSEPVQPVTITLTMPDGQTQVDLPMLTFTAADWDTPQTVTVTAVDDDVDETDPHPAAIETAAASPDPNYDGIAVDDVALDVRDDDTAGVTITESGAGPSTDVTEAGAVDTYEVVLTSQPTADVVITVAGGTEATPGPTTLTFTAGNWNQVQVVTVTATPDFRVEGLHTQVVTHVAASGDANYDAIAIADVTANITDDDNAGVTIAPLTVDVGESGATGTYTVVLDAEPDLPVTVTLAPDGQLGTDAPTLTFDNTNWNIAQTVTVNAVDDLIVEADPHPGTIVHTTSSADPDFDALTVSDVIATIDDNDTPGVVVAPTSVTTTEGAPDGTYTVSLLSMPTQPVDIVFSEGGQLVPIAPLTIQPADWDQPHTVTVVAFDDFIAEGPHATVITHDTMSADPFYAPGTLTIDDVDVDILDNDNAGVLMTPNAGLAGMEGDVVTFDVSLTSEPTAPVTITLAGDADGGPAPTTLTFDASNWSVVQQVSITIVDDFIAEGAHTSTTTHVVSSADPFYDALVVTDQVVAVTDNDNAGVVLTPGAPGPLLISEDGTTATYTVELTSEPTADVTIDIVSVLGQASATASTLTFTAANWNVAQTVTVAAIDDDVDETDPHSDDLSHLALSSDPFYDNIVIPNMLLTIGDDDTAGITVTQTGPDSVVEEGGPGDTVDIVLDSEPVAPVTITFAGVQVGAVPLSITFDASNWDLPVSVPVDAIDDAIFEGPHTGTLDGVASSGDPNYDTMAMATHTFDVIDDDTAGVIITPPAANTLDEADTAASQGYQVRLESEPTQPVDVTITPDAQVVAAPVTLTFTPADWNIDQPVTVTPVDDPVIEADPHPGFTTHDTTSADPFYASGVLTIDQVEFSITDNDVPSFTVTPTSPHAVAEGGATSTYTIVLGTLPSAPVTIAPTSTQLQWTVPSVTFDGTNWNVPQTVTLQAIDDNFDELDPHPGTIVHDVTSADANYQGLVVAGTDVDALIGDNDISELLVAQLPPNVVDEADPLVVSQYVLTLTSIPTAPVVVTLSPDAELLTGVPTVTLDSTNWNTGVTVDVTAFDDDIDETEPHPGVVAHTLASADANYDGKAGPDASFDVSDDDTAGIIVAASGGSTDVAEDGSLVDDYTVVLQSEPTDDVTITITAADGQTTPGATTLTFTPANWDTPQVVSIAAFDDAIVEAPVHPAIVTHVATSTDPLYAVAGPDVNVNVVDDDVPDVVLTPAGGTLDVAENGPTDILNIALGSEPVAPVTIDLAGDVDVDVAPTSVTIQPADWQTGVDITVTAIDDPFIEHLHTGTISFVVSSPDPVYDGFARPSTTADITDDDVANVTVTQTGATTEVAEAGATTDTFDLVLTASPQAPVTIDLTNADGQVAFTGPSSFTFDSSNWNVPQTVTVAAVDDAFDEADPHTGIVSFAIVTTDPDFGPVIVPDVNVTVADDDTAGVVVTPTSGISVAEAGATSQTVDVVLLSSPVSPVTITVTGDADATVSPGTLTFDSVNWNIPQPVTITAVDDEEDETDPHPAQVLFEASSLDPNYATLPSQTADVAVADDDTAAVFVTPATATTVDEDQTTTTTYDVVLDSMPTGPVDVVFVPDAQVEVVSGATLTFDATDWNAPKQVVVQAVDDVVDELSPHPGILAWSMTSVDPNYQALPGDLATLDVTDNDVAGVEMTSIATPYVIDEDRTQTATWNVRLDTQPTADVVVTFANADGQVDVPTQLTFTPLNWNAYQSVSVQAVDDAIAETTPHPATLTSTVDSTDPFYALAAGLVTPTQLFDITDEDIPAWDLVPAAGDVQVAEAGATSDTYELHMLVQPAGPVTVNLASDAQVSVSPATHTFTPANYATPLTITVTAIDDQTVEDKPHPGVITHALDPSSHAAYLATTIPDVSAVVDDDDIAEVIVDPLDGIVVDEDGATSDTFEVRLGAAPATDVTVDAASLALPAQLTVTGGTLTFTPANWSAPQTVTVTAVDDFLDEPAVHQTDVTFTVGGNSHFAGLAVTPVPVDINDNDDSGIVVTHDGTLEVDEAGTLSESVTFTLTSEPVAPVTITGSETQFTVSGPIVLDATNWNTGVTVTLAGVQDTLAEATPFVEAWVLTLATVDPTYTSLTIPDETVSVIDDDVAGFNIVPMANWDLSSGALELAEGGSGASMVLETIGDPVGDVIVDISVSPSLQVEVTNNDSHLYQGGSAGSAAFTFTAVDDAIVEANPHLATATFTISTSDPRYGTVVIPDVPIEIEDNDVAGFVVDAASPMNVEEGGDDATFTLALSAQPSGDVTVGFDGGTQLTVNDGNPITFTPLNWSIPRVISVEAIDDPDAEGTPHAGQVDLSVVTAVIGYPATIAPLDVDIRDNDFVGVRITPTDDGHEVTEPGETDQMTVSLGSRPSGDVTITVTGDAQVTPGATTLTFTPAGWDAEQSLEVEAVQDQFVEGVHSGNLTFTLSSSDADYDAGGPATPPAEIVTVIDDDRPSVQIEESSGATTLSEDGGEDQYTVRLNTRPLGEVEVAVQGGDQVQAEQEVLTFDSDTWDDPQTVTVTAIDDGVDEADPHPGRVNHVVSSEAPGWADALASHVEADIADNDGAGIRIVRSDDSNEVAEGEEEGDTLTVVLSSQPATPVRITALADKQVKVEQGAMVFSAENWNEPQEVAFTAVDDKLVEGDHTGNVAFRLTTDELAYRRMRVPTSQVDITDNDVAREPDETVDEDDEQDEVDEPDPRVPPATVPEDTDPGDGTDGEEDAATPPAEDDTAPDAGEGQPGSKDGTADTGVEIVEDADKDGEAKEEDESIGLVAAAKKLVSDNSRLGVLLMALGALLAGAMTYLYRRDSKRMAQAAAAAAEARRQRVAAARRRKHDDEDPDPPSEPRNRGGR